MPIRLPNIIFCCDLQPDFAHDYLLPKYSTSQCFVGGRPGMCCEPRIANLHTSSTSVPYSANNHITCRLCYYMQRASSSHNLKVMTYDGEF
ncbi:hypothetical protein J6590_046685 [Homalodisca vitripennis]|nr:hypothetical protein J6590_046685 [Homalodisca vitripennis]